MLAELVKAGKLPPVEQRVPEEPMVIKPLESIGKYGGTWRRGFTGPADGENGNRIMSIDKLIFWDYQGTKQKPGTCRGGRSPTAARTITFFLRKGHKWSDGAPFTADDFMFWYEDIYGNKDLDADADLPRCRSTASPARSRRSTRRPSTSSSRTRIPASWT